MNNMSYAGKDGCCLYCPDRKNGCWCDKCKCHSCIWYQTIKEDDTELGRYSFRDYLGFETLNADKILNITYNAYVISKKGITHVLPKAHARLIYKSAKGQVKFKIPVWLKEQILKNEEKPKICLRRISPP